MHLQIYCTGFTDSELDPLSRIDSVIKHPLYSTNLPSLKLTGCHDFTIQVLKDVVNAPMMCWLESSPTVLGEEKHFKSLEVSEYGA